MPGFDERLTRELERAARPADAAGVSERMGGRRARRARVRRVESGLLAVAVLGATAFGFVALRAAFQVSGGTGVEPTVLPANGRIVFARWEGEERSHLYTMQHDGSDVRQLTDFVTSDEAPAVSPDGGTVAFVHQLEDRGPVIGSIPIEGGVVSWLTDERLFVTGGPSWSPDGSRIAFAAHDGDGQRLFVMDANGTDQHPLTGDDLYWVETAAWSPDGARIAFTASLISGDEEPSRWDVFTIRPDGTDLVNVTESPAEADDEGSVTWAPDGETIAFSRPAGEGVAIVVRRLSDGMERTLGDGSTVDTSPAWSPDGRLIVFDRATLDRGAFDLWSMRPDGTEVTRLTTEGGFSAAWQPIPAGSDPTPTVSPEPTLSPNPDPEGKEVGLGFKLCDSERLGGIDFLGNGTNGYAWVGVPSKDDGTCPKHHGVGAYVVAADADGDGEAETWNQLPWRCYVDCVPYDATDLDGNGTEELIVTSYFSIMDYYVMRYLGPPDEPSPVIVPILVGDPGHPPAGLHAGEPLRIDAGGDAGYGSQIECEGYPENPVLVWSWSYHPVDSDQPREVHITRIQLGSDGHFHVVDTNDYTVPADQPSGIERSEAPACGVDFHPNA